VTSDGRDVQLDVVREARLRPEAAASYPGIPPGIWMPAAELGARLLVQHLAAARPVTLGSRLLDEHHFEFRGGVRRGTGGTFRTRYGENGSGPARA
jgi:hypothetical protein